MISLQPYHTFHCKVLANKLYRIKSKNDVRACVKSGKFRDKKYLILGKGSNVLFQDDFNGEVYLDEIKGIDIIEDNQEVTKVSFGAGEVWHDVVLWALNQGLNGIENLSLIPGTIGAAPIQNIGAYGVELKDVFHSLEAIHLGSGELSTFDLADCKFGYRDSIFKNEVKGTYFITRVTLSLRKDHFVNTTYGDINQWLSRKYERSVFTPAEVSEAVITIRESKLPNTDLLGNAGSFFKNPIIPMEQYLKLQMNFPDMPSFEINPELTKVPAGWLIEQCGLKGRRFGNTGCYEKQALVIVNYGDATAVEIFQFANFVIEKVKTKFGITIQPEVNLIR